MCLPGACYSSSNCDFLVSNQSYFHKCNTLLLYASVVKTTVLLPPKLVVAVFYLEHKRTGMKLWQICRKGGMSSICRQRKHKIITVEHFDSQEYREDRPQSVKKDKY